jgi:hypothetical protein
VIIERARMRLGMRPFVDARWLITAALALWSAPVAAQQWSVEAHAGRIRSALDPGAPQSETFMVGLRYDAPFTAFRISTGIPTESTQPLWAAVGAAKRLALRSGNIAGGLDVSGHAFLLHDRVDRTREVPGLFGQSLEALPGLSGHAVAGQFMPVIGYETERFQVHGRAGVSHYSGKFGEQTRDRTVKVADAEVLFAPAASVTITPAVRHFIAEEDNYTYAGVSAGFVRGRAGVWGTIGHWLATENQRTPWAIGASAKLHDRATLHASVRNDALDPLYLNPPQTAWSLGMSVQLTRPVTALAPVPASYVNGRATIRLSVSQSNAAPRIAGDFNAWKPQPMQRSGDHWTFSVAVAPGVYNYAFVNARGDWFVPEKHPGRKDDGMGGHVAVLVVQ